MVNRGFLNYNLFEKLFQLLTCYALLGFIIVNLMCVYSSLLSLNHRVDYSIVFLINTVQLSLMQSTYLTENDGTKGGVSVSHPVKKGVICD